MLLATKVVVVRKSVEPKGSCGFESRPGHLGFGVRQKRCNRKEKKMFTYYCVQEFHNSGTFVTIIKTEKKPCNQTYNDIGKFLKEKDDMDFERDSLQIIPESDTETVNME